MRAAVDLDERGHAVLLRGGQRERLGHGALADLVGDVVDGDLGQRQQILDALGRRARRRRVQEQLARARVLAHAHAQLRHLPRRLAIAVVDDQLLEDGARRLAVAELVLANLRLAQARRAALVGARRQLGDLAVAVGGALPPALLLLERRQHEVGVEIVGRQRDRLLERRHRRARVLEPIALQPRLQLEHRRALAHVRRRRRARDHELDEPGVVLVLLVQRARAHERLFVRRLELEQAPVVAQRRLLILQLVERDAGRGHERADAIGAIGGELGLAREQRRRQRPVAAGDGEAAPAAQERQEVGRVARRLLVDRHRLRAPRAIEPQRRFVQAQRLDRRVRRVVGGGGERVGEREAVGGGVGLGHGAERAHDAARHQRIDLLEPSGVEEQLGAGGAGRDLVAQGGERAIAVRQADVGAARAEPAQRADERVALARGGGGGAQLGEREDASDLAAVDGLRVAGRGARRLIEPVLVDEPELAGQRHLGLDVRGALDEALQLQRRRREVAARLGHVDERHRRRLVLRMARLHLAVALLRRFEIAQVQLFDLRDLVQHERLLPPVGQRAGAPLERGHQLLPLPVAPQDAVERAHRRGVQRVVGERRARRRRRRRRARRACARARGRCGSAAPPDRAGRRSGRAGASRCR